MLKRPKQHKLETASRVALERAIAARWIFRSLNPDYGLDGELEEFDAEDRTTGLRFPVQLKSTGERDRSKALTLIIPEAHAEYYRALHQPVLMVRYLEHYDQLYLRWFHQYDRVVDGATRRGIKFRWRDEDVWNDDRSVDIALEARQYLALLSSRAGFPLRLHVVWNLEEEGRTEFSAHLSTLIKIVPDIVFLSPGDLKPGDVVLTLSSKSMHVDLAKVTSATLHFDQEISARDASLEQIAATGVSLLAMALERVGQAAAVGRLTALSFADSLLVNQIETAFALASQMRVARLVTEAVDLFEELDSKGEEYRDVALAFWVAVSSLGPTLTAKQTAALRHGLARRIERLGGNPKATAADRFNLAAMAYDSDDSESAWSQLEAAAEADPKYESRAHWWLLGGLVKQAENDWERATEMFAEAVALERTPLAVLRLADARVATGSYETALEGISHDDTDRPPEEPWVSQLAVVQLACEALARAGFGVQTRDTRANDDLLALADLNLGSCEDGFIPEHVVRGFLNRDALSPFAWLLLTSGEFALPADVLRDACLLAAWLSGGSTDVWIASVEAFFTVGPVEWIPYLVVHADYVTEGTILPQLATELEKGDFRDLFLRAAEESVFDARLQREGTFTVRMIDSGDTVTFPSGTAAALSPQR